MKLLGRAEEKECKIDASMKQHRCSFDSADAISDPQRSSLNFPYGELVQKRQNALALNVFFTQGNWVFRENDIRLRGDENQSPVGSPEAQGYNNTFMSAKSSDMPHCYELEFAKLHIFQLIKHAGTVHDCSL